MKEPPPLHPEFRQALDLIDARLHLQDKTPKKTGKSYGKWFNCVEIDYVSRSDKSIIGGFNGRTSNYLHLDIEINPEAYKTTNPLLLAILISHELQHAIQYMNFQLFHEELPCMESEVEAHMTQYQFIKTLTAGELQTVRGAFNDPNSQLLYGKRVNMLLRLGETANNECLTNKTPGEDCIMNHFEALLKKELQTNSDYARQCQIDDQTE